MKDFIIFIISIIIIYGGYIAPFGVYLLLSEIGMFIPPSKGGSLIPFIFIIIFSFIWIIWMLSGGKIMIQKWVIRLLGENPEQWK